MKTDSAYGAAELNRDLKRLGMTQRDLCAKLTGIAGRTIHPSVVNKWAKDNGPVPPTLGLAMTLMVELADVRKSSPETHLVDCASSE